MPEDNVTAFTAGSLPDVKDYGVFTRQRVTIEAVAEGETEPRKFECFVHQLRMQERTEIGHRVDAIGKKDADDMAVELWSMSVELVQRTMRDEAGALLFEGTEGRAYLDNLPGPWFDQLLAAAQSFNGLVDDEAPGKDEQPPS